MQIISPSGDILSCTRCDFTPPGCAQETLEGLELFSRRLAGKWTGPSSAEHRMENTKTNCGDFTPLKQWMYCRMKQLYGIINRLQPRCRVTLAPMSANNIDFEIRTCSRTTSPLCYFLSFGRHQ
jgi:hypothetical protein